MEPESPTKQPLNRAAAFQQSELGNISNVEEVINVLKTDEDEYQQLIRVSYSSSLSPLSLPLMVVSALRKRRRS
jgi:hypothetical protein